MPNYLVGVSLNLRGNFGAGMRGAASQTEQLRGVVARTAGQATGALRRTAGAAAGVGDALGRTSRRSGGAMRRIAGAAGLASGALERAAGAARRVGTATRRMADTAGTAVDRARRKVDGLIGRFRALERTGRGAGAGIGGGFSRLAGYAGGGFAVARAGQQAASMDTLVRRLSRESGRSMGDLTGLRDRAYQVGAERGVQAGELMQAVVAAQAAGGVRIERDDLASLAVIMQRAGVTGAEAGTVWARVSMLPGETRENVATLARQADAGELQFRGVIDQIERLVGSVRSWATDETAVAQMGAMMNIARAGSGSIDEASAALDTLTREAVMRADKIREIFGVDVLSSAPGREGFLREDFSAAIMEIADSARAWGGEARLLEAFGADSMRAIKGLLTKEGARKGRESLAIRGDWAPFVADADAVAEGIEARAIAMMQQLEGALTQTITGPMQGAFSLMQAYQTELMVGTAGALGVANLVSRYRLGRKLAEGARNQTVATSTVATMRVGTLVVGSMPGGGGPGGRQGPGGGGAILGPDGRPMAKQPPAGGAAGPAGGKRGRLAGWSRILRRAAPGTGLVTLGVLEAAPALAAGDTRGVARAGAGVGGGVAGAKAGAAIGTFLGGPVGTIVGGLAGSFLGWLGAEQLFDSLLADRERPRRSVRGRTRREDLVARTAGVERAGPGEADEPDVDVEPAEDVGERTRREDLVARTAGVERAGPGEADEPDVDVEPALVGSVRSWATDETAVAQMGAMMNIARAGSGSTDETAVAQMGAMMNIARAGSGSIDEASAALDTLTREAVMRADKIREIFGVDVLSSAPGREGFLREDFSAAIMEIADSARAWGGEARLLEAFGADSMRAIKGLLEDVGERTRREDLVARTAGVERAGPGEADEPDVDVEPAEDVGERPRRSVRGRTRREDLVARTAGVERAGPGEADEPDVDVEPAEDVGGRPRRSVRGRSRRGELMARERGGVTYDHSDRRVSSVTIEAGAITVQGADDPAETADLVVERVAEEIDRRQQDRDRQTRHLVIEDPEPDPMF